MKQASLDDLKTVLPEEVALNLYNKLNSKTEEK